MNDRNPYRGRADGVSAEQELRDAESAAAKNAHLRRAAADAEATRYLAEMECPPDLIEWGERHRIPMFAEFTWMAGFVAGWRAAHSRRRG